VDSGFPAGAQDQIRLIARAICRVADG
jgi:hypothetical protein